MLISVVVPCFNEEAVIERFHERLTQETAALDLGSGLGSEPGSDLGSGLGSSLEFVYVDDGSDDGTLLRLSALAAEDPRIRYISFSRNFGKEAAMLAGLEHAAGDALVIMDADLQHPPELIPRMVELHREGFDQVIARRTRKGDRVTRTLTARAYYWLINRFMDVEIVDGAGDFRLLSRRAADSVTALTEYNRFSKGLFAWVGYPSTTFSYENAAREDGQSKWSFGKLLNYGLDGLLSFNNKPLRAAFHFGVILMAVAAVYAVWIVGGVLTSGVDTPGYATLLVVITALAGAQISMMGIVGEYIGRIYYEVKRRPHYLVKATNTPTADVPSAAPAGPDRRVGRPVR
ncbi:glycosyltransferase family 2 protein [Streptomyces sp. NPDC092295]|uniref:glycosyltransferase family 2 protein n=1 Tax=Streptomyces sp. NPDC092295 TaxID=3366011 RepID=UPI003821AA3B